jgi:hypothetical protein
LKLTPILPVAEIAIIITIIITIPTVAIAHQDSFGISELYHQQQMELNGILHGIMVMIER